MKASARAVVAPAEETSSAPRHPGWLGALCFLVLGASCTAPEPAGPGPAIYESDVLVYGATSGGILAALEVARHGRSVALLEPSTHLGGLTTGGLGATDVGREAAIGGRARAFYRSVRAHYEQESAWRQETRDEYLARPAGQRYVLSDVQFSFEPHVALEIYLQWLAEAGIEPIFEAELARVETQDGRIESIVLAGGRELRARVFIDATYEGDLMARAGVSYTVGRESNATYGETLNGVQTELAIHHQFVRDVDPYRVAGDPESGLLPGIEAEPPGPEGAGDAGVQAYCFRLCTTDVPENRVPWPKPEGYDEHQYELLLRNFEAGDHRIPWSPRGMPNRKTDTNNNFAISTDYIGQSWDYPEADHASRRQIVVEHERYQKGLLWTLAYHPRVPEEVREHFQTWGLAKDELVDHDHWPPQLYIREARRMIGEYVVTENDCRGRRAAEDPVALGAYNMDSHHVHRYVTAEGFARNEGDVQVGVPAPYGISYRALVPQRDEVTNLLVPVCVSSSHIAYGSIRMEPVFMELGQAAGAAAALAIEAKVAVQDVGYARLRQVLLEGEARLEAPGRGVPISELGGVVCDDSDALLIGEWEHSTSVGGYVARGYRHDGNAGKGEREATFELEAPETGRYRVRLAYTAHGNRATNVPVAVRCGEREIAAMVNQRVAPEIEDRWTEIATIEAAAGERVVVTVANEDTDGYVIIDAVQLLRR